jgi:hypothetical protein
VNSVHFLTASSSLAAAGIALGLVLAGPSGCNQPATKCSAQGGEGIVRYTPVGTPAGDGGAPAACANSTLPLGPNSNSGTFYIGVESYPVDPEDPNGPNTPASIALQPEWIGARIEDAQLNAAVDPTVDPSVLPVMANYPYASAADVPQPPPQGTGANYPYAWGQFESVAPDSAGICRVPNMLSDLVYPDIPAHTAAQQIGSPLGLTSEDGGPGNGTYELGGASVPDQPATHVTYAWSNVRVYVSAAETGVQTYGDLTITQDGCSAASHVSILVPRVPCGGTDDAGAPIADNTLCNPLPDGINNPSGSGINPAVAPSCENIGTADNPDFECLPPAQDPQSQLQ